MQSMRLACWLLGLVGLLSMAADATADGSVSFESLSRDYDGKVRPILKQSCLGCHSTAKRKGELDLEVYARLEDFRRSPQIWQKIGEALDSGEMPPKGAGSSRPRSGRAARLGASLPGRRGRANAGDPGRVVMRRLNNVEYNNTVRDLTGIDLRPAREFPADAAAGEGFTNVGDALVMSPSMLDKYLAAAKSIAAPRRPLARRPAASPRRPPGPTGARRS